MLRKQIFVAIGMTAAVVTLVTLWLHLADLRLPLPDGDDQVSRLPHEKLTLIPGHGHRFHRWPRAFLDWLPHCPGSARSGSGP